MKRLFVLIAFFAASLTGFADVKLQCMFTDNAVLQQGLPLPVSGTAEDGEKVTVHFQTQELSTVAKDGKWQVRLEPLQAGGPFEMTIKGKNEIVLKNLLIGEVWVCSGQSNMGFTLAGAHDAEQEIPKASYPKIRLFSVKLSTAFEPQSTCAGQWVECTPESAKSFTAAGYYFGRDIHKALGVPVGLINSSWGGTPAQAWTSLPGLKGDPTLDGYVKSFEQIIATIDQMEEKYQKETLPKWEALNKKWQQEMNKPYQEAMAKWRKEAAAAKAAGQAAPAEPKSPGRGPRKPESPKHDPHMPAVLYNAMIQPLLPYPIRGAIWYQGESNASKPVEYQTLFPTMIKDWRRAWGVGDFPFLFVQLANYMKRETDPVQTEGGWPGLREAQTMTLKLPNTGQAVIIDIGEGDDIHPKNKADVGGRLALAGLKVAYNKEIVYSGPMYDSMKVEGDKVRVKFQSIGKGLTIGVAPAIRLGQAPNQPLDHLVGFSIAGEDKKFVWADAKIDGDSVIVSSASVKQPVAVRYAWANNPECNLYNKEGLPASPFRTDDWKGNPPSK